ncbi:hypothetical protein DOTSEDRAFT_37805 [Dothistroma septosporum NZE10]|uniref:Tautomerase cis-CaaD-like domain-containing protein n=1 Tax=Dothistroma septosporum (strain NZE10 / CBS 128990) TaxID=675120 RepID=N1PHT9_DOTSN|nr:hypothetical protein DOTSEDRAFT_37805 [Dothistroma septosporum NZE10]
MPLYEIQHICPLTTAQQDELAIAITRIHSTKFTTPKMFVNVKFTDAKEHVTYIGGKRRQGNHILANVRVGPSRTQKDWDSLCAEIVGEWNRIVPMPKVKRYLCTMEWRGKGTQWVGMMWLTFLRGRSAPDEDHTLRSCILLGGLIGGYEAGFMIPPAGGDVQWMKDNWDEFKMKAQSDEEFKDMVDEVEERGLMNGAGKSSKQKLEEALGWGDSA